MSFDSSPAERSDMRGASREYRRQVESHHKWARGTVVASGRDESHPKPAPKDHHLYSLNTKADRLAHAKNRYSSKSYAAKQLDMLSACENTLDDHFATDSSAPTSAEEDNATEVTAPLPDESIMYSFDNARGPSSGSQLLSAVVDRAVEKFEDQETAQLVRDEYEVVDADGKSIKPRSRKGKRAAKRPSAREEDEYEFV